MPSRSIVEGLDVVGNVFGREITRLVDVLLDALLLQTAEEGLREALANLLTDEAFFSIDELGPVAVKMRGGRSLQFPGQVRTVPQWQKSRGTIIVTAALEMASNQVVYFYSTRKNTEETIRLIDLLCEQYSKFKCLYLSWDSAPWHRSQRLLEYLSIANSRAKMGLGPKVRCCHFRQVRSFST